MSAIRFDREKFKTFEAMQQIADMKTWHYGHVIEPSGAALTKAREMVMAIGPLNADGPESIIMAPSVAGGVVLTFVQGKRDITVACLNTGDLLVVLGQCWFGALRAWDVSAKLSYQVVDEVKRFFSKAGQFDKAQDHG